MTDPSDGIWDDGEWISWDYINEQLEEQDLSAKYPDATIELIRTFEDLVETAATYRKLTGRYLQIWGELGAFYAEVKYGLRRHKTHAPGSDERLGDDLVKVKTISPEKASEQVLVKRAGNFNKLIIVKISQDFEFESRIISRKCIGKGLGIHAKINWGDCDERETGA